MTQSESQEKTCIILIGGAGCGKSTLTNVLSTGGAITSGSSNSCTKVCTIYSVDSKTTLMDTPGFDDSDNLTDTEIIKMMTTSLGKAKSPYAKIIWCVEQSCRAKKSIQRQARLINALGGSIWKSVIIICKKGDPDDPSDWQGATNSAAKYSAKIKYCLGITNIECLPDKKQKKLKKRDFSVRSEDGEYFPDEIKKLVFNTLSKISPWQAKLRKVYHHASNYDTHSGSLQRKSKRKCTGCWRSPDSNIYSSRSISHGTWYCHTRGCNKQFNVGDTFYHCWPCCDRNSHSNDRYVIGCRGMTCKSCVERTYWEYSCCDKSEGSSGCVTSCCRRNRSSTLTTKCGDITYEPQNL